MLKRRSFDNIDNVKKYLYDICGDEYTLLGNYRKDNKSRIEIRHNKCGNIWNPNINSFITNGNRCPKCFGTKQQSREDLIIRCFKLHGKDYKIINFDNYTNNKSKICVKHKCGYEYNVVVQNFFNIGSKCPKCSGKLKLSKEDIINRCQKIFGRDYTPNIIDYPKNGKSKMIMTHNLCGNTWTASISNIIYNNTGCPFCKMTKGERKIKKYLDDNKLEYISQFRFADCKFDRPLIFDFYLPNHNICIEYDGVQHFDTTDEYSSKAIIFFGGVNAHDKRKMSDQKKNEFCNDNNIKLIRIDYKSILKISDILGDIFEKI